MTTIRPLPSQRLRAILPADRVPWNTSDAIPRTGQRRSAPQPRALKALELALHIRAAGYNVYLSGEPNLGRTYLVREFLTPRARKAPTPPDLLYVNNFDDPDKPRLLTVPAGQGRRLRASVSLALADIRKELPARLENEIYVKKRSEIQNRFQNTRSRLIREMDRIAVGEGFNLDLDEHGSLTLYPLVEGKRLSEEEYDRLDAPLRDGLKQKGDGLLRAMSGMVRKLSNAEQAFHADEKTLDREVAAAVLDSVLTPAAERCLRACPDNEALRAYFDSLRDDILENPESFLPRDNQPQSGSGQGGYAGGYPGGLLAEGPHDPDPYPYDVNLFVDNSGVKGAPLIVEEHPTAANLLGCIERESEMGALVTDFTLIKAGSLHRANGGFLVLHLEDLLQHPAAWEGLLRALRAGAAKLEEGGECAADGAVRTKGIEPEPVPLDLKVVLVGGDDLYDSLLANDDRFPKLFKIKAHMTDTVERTAADIRAWLIRLAGIIDEAQLLPFSREALAGLVDFSSRVSEDQKKLSLKFPLMRDVMIEASAVAAMSGAPLVLGEHLQQALDDRVYRANLIEELYMEEYDRELIQVDTSGAAVGRVNGLSVTWHGDFEFGLPHQISCTVGVGHGGILDLEREAELGGPIHTKAILILKSYLVDQFARDKPLVLTGSLCFEQNYAGVEGDSASGAELAALLSAISRVPLRLSLAFTGAVSQSGQIMAVGGVSRKIEGFFNVCSRRGLTGEQGVIIPRDNIDHLMLPQKIVDAVDAGRFAIYPVRHISEAMELLTGLPAGRPLKHGGFSPDSLYDRVDRRLIEFGQNAEHAFSGPTRHAKKQRKAAPGLHAGSVSALRQIEQGGCRQRKLR